MQIISRQNCIGVDSQTMVGNKSEGSAEYGRDMQRRCRVNEESPRSSGFERFMQILARQNYIGTNTPHGATTEIHASVIRHPEG